MKWRFDETDFIGSITFATDNLKDFMTAILGISAFYHDSAAALLVDGEIVAAAQEERFTRKKNDAAFPKHAIDFCLKQAGLTAAEIDHVGFYEKPLLKFDRLLETYLSYSPSGFLSFRKAMPEWAGPKLQLRREIRRGLGNQYQGRICFCEHHQSHAASAFYASPFEDAAILTLDGVGEWATSTMGVGHGNQLRLMKEIRFPHSLGLLYSAITYFAGFRVNSDEYKLMGLAPYGEPRYVEVIRENLIKIFDDGSYRMNLDYFDYPQGLRMTSRKFNQLFGASPRNPSEPVRELDMDLAASIQKVTEDVVLRASHHLFDLSGIDNLCLAGGVALNCVSNGNVLRNGPFRNVWVQPAAGDAGGALGAAQFIWHQLMEKPRSVSVPDGQRGSLLGPEVSEESLQASLDAVGAKYQVFETEPELAEDLSRRLDEGELMGIARGRMEFGPRALGNRSIVADARRRDTQRDLNLKTKFRESFRPFAPIVMREHVSDYFQWDADQESPYMLMVTGVNSSIREAVDPTLPKGLDRVNDIRSHLPAITHVDYSARLQTVDQIRNPFLWMLLDRFKQRTGCPVLVNTSFNVKDEPIVNHWADALACFMQTNLDVLVLENCVLEKSRQSAVDLQALERIRDLPFVGQRNKEQRQTRQFVGSLCLALGLLSGLVYYRFHAPVFAGIILVIAMLTTVGVCLGDSVRSLIESGFKRLTLPIRFVVTLVLLAVVYYLVVTPIGVLLRFAGRDLRRSDRKTPTQWTSWVDRDLESYFQTY